MNPLRLIFYGTSILPALDTEHVMLVGQTDCTDELRRLCVELQPQVLLLQCTNDIPLMRACIKECREYAPRAKIIVYATINDAPYARALVSAGAMGYVTELQDLTSVLRTVQSGKLVLPPHITRLLFLSA